MNRNSKIFLGLAIFLFCCAFAFKFTLGNDGFSFELMQVDWITLMMGFLVSTVVMIIFSQHTKREDYLDNDELELKELSTRKRKHVDGDEYV